MIGMAAQIYSPEAIKACVLQSLGYHFQLLAKFAVRYTLGEELRGLNIDIPLYPNVEEVELEVFEELDSPFSNIILISIQRIIAAQDQFILFNALSIDTILEHDEGLELAVDLAQYFLMIPLENVIDEIFVDTDALYLNLEYMLYLLAYLICYERIDMDSDEFEGYWSYTIDEKVFSFMDSPDKNISLLRTLADELRSDRGDLVCLEHKLNRKF